MKLRRKFHRPMRSVYVVIAVAITLVALLPAFNQGAAASQITSRSIQMSDSTAGAAGVKYNVSFNSITTGNTQGIVIDFCDDTPIIGSATCTTPTGFSLGASPTIANQSTTSGCNISTFSSVTTLNSNRTFVVTAASAVNFTTTPCAISFTVTAGGAGNSTPTTANHSFYARIYTYDTSAHATGYTLAGYATGNLDAGGIALSTAANISITAKVQEQLSFCVYMTSCGTAASISLGNTQGVLSSSGPFVDLNTKYDIQTNASGNAIVNIQGPTLTSGSNTIAALTTAHTSTSGTSQFGLCTYESSGSTITPNTNYNGVDGVGGTSCTANAGLTQTAGTGSTGGSGGAAFYFGTNAQGTYGDTIASDAAGAAATGIIAFLGNTSTSQTAGIYTTTLKLIATGTF